MENGLKKFVPIVEEEDMDGAVLVEITTLEELQECSEKYKPKAHEKKFVKLIDKWKKEGVAACELKERVEAGGGHS